MTRKAEITAHPVMTAKGKTSGLAATVYYYDGTFYMLYNGDHYLHAVPGQLTLNLRDFQPYPGIPTEKVTPAPVPEQGTQKTRVPRASTGHALATIRADYTALNTPDNWGFKVED